MSPRPPRAPSSRTPRRKPRASKDEGRGGDATNDERGRVRPPRRTVRNAASGQRKSSPGAARHRKPEPVGRRGPAVFVATKNPGKARELAELLEDASIRIVGPAKMGSLDAPVEDGKTFRDNAVKKALHYSRLVGELVLADDSGLEIDALDGKPGVRSARLGGPAATDADRVRLILAQMADVAWEFRTARFRCAIACAIKGELLATFDGVVEGRIAFEPDGAEGFGYDPIFYFDPAQRTFGALKPHEKHSVSHRGQALEKAALYLRERFAKSPREGR